MNGTPLERFMAKVDRSETCWLWTAHRNPKGYGRFALGRRRMLAHRFAYREFVGEIPVGMEIDHICLNRACVNPAHLRLVSHGQNLQNRSQVGRGASGIRGVHRNGKRWAAVVKVNGIAHRIEGFATPEEAEPHVIALRNELMTHNTADRAA